jgi:gliding motility-associated protein GldM
MAGGKETPRQKMIGMMYLVLTALLALNVSKEIIAAFVTINDKLDASGEIVNQGIKSTYGEFDAKRLGIQQQGGDMKVFDLWNGKAKDVNKRSRQVVSFILGESNEMIKEAEGGKDWIAEQDEDGYIMELKSLFDISAMDNYDIPTNRFIGGNPMKPKKEGLALRDSVLAFRDYVTAAMGTYSLGDKKYSFEAPADTSQLEDALMSANEEDREAIRRVYNALSVPEKIGIKNAGQVKEVPWPSAMFDHAPIVAAAAMLTALKVDVLTAESQAADFFLSKIDAPSFSFNKIEPLAFARSSYINRGDSIGLSVMVAAYDSTKDMKLRYWVNDSTMNSANMKTFEGKAGEKLNLRPDASGDQFIMGQTAVEVKGKEEWIPWKFRFSVGEPQGTVSLPEMNVLYRGYQNKVQGAASGFPSFKLSGGGNVSLKQSGKEYIASPGSGREASINIVGVAEDGSTANLGSFKFRVQNLPKPSIRLGRLEDGSSATSSQIRASSRLFAGYPPEIPLKAKFSVKSWEVQVGRKRANGTGSALTGPAKRILAQAASGDVVTISTTYVEPGGRTNRRNASFKVK